MESRTAPILALDTSGEPASACVLLPEPASAVVLRVAENGERAGAALHRLLAAVLEEAGLKPGDAFLIAAARGPGSFTGLRVGLAAAQGLALASRAEAVGIETTLAIAEASGRLGEILVLLDGGQGRLFAGLHHAGPQGAEQVRGPDDLSPEEALARLRAHAGAALLRGEPPCAADLVAAGCVRFDEPLAPAVARLARRVRPEPGGLQALYARAPAIRPPSPGRASR